MQRIMLLLGAVATSEAFAGGAIDLEQFPPNGEICQYAGAANYNGKIQATTLYSRNDNEIKVQTLVKFTAGLLGVNKDSKFDESVYFDAKTGALLRIEKNNRELSSGWTGKSLEQLWDVIKFEWDSAERTEANRMNYWRISGKDENDFSARYPAFSKYWALDMFAKPWSSDFFGSDPDARRDLDLVGFDNRIVPALFLSFYLPRIADPSKDDTFFIIVHKSEKGIETVTTAPIHPTYTRSSSKTVIRSKIHIGNMSSPTDQDSFLDIEDGLLKNIKFVLQQPGSNVKVEGEIKLSSCKPHKSSDADTEPTPKDQDEDGDTSPPSA